VLLLVLPFFILTSFDLVSGYYEDVALLLALGVVFAYKFRIIRATLMMHAFPSVLFVLFDLVFVTLVDAVVFSTLKMFQ